MAKLLLGSVFYKDVFAGYLEEKPNGATSFTYNSHYIADGHPAISHRLPVREEPHISDYGLHPFFDNLVSEGWLEKLQSRTIRSRGEVSRFELLLTFGYDLVGAVSVIDREAPKKDGIPLSMNDAKDMDDLESVVSNIRSSISGMQPKIAVIEENGVYRASGMNELSTHIAKFSSPNLEGLVTYEYLAMLAFKALLPNEEVAEVKIEEADKIGEFLVVKRFDRMEGERIHFEEFNQLLGKYSHDKYEGSHKDMADFILQNDKNVATQNYSLYCRILAGILVGNTDMHLKNFAMFHTGKGFSLTPSYDQVPAVIYGVDDSMGLEIAGLKHHSIKSLKPKHFYALGDEFYLPSAMVDTAIMRLGKNMEAAFDAINEAPKGYGAYKSNLIKLMRNIWNRTFSSTGKAL